MVCANSRGPLDGLDESPASDFHVKYERLGTFGDLLGHDRTTRSAGSTRRVPVTSRNAYRRRSTGARPAPAAQITAPTDSSCWRISSLESEARQPGIDSSLSSVPPVCPSPRPDNWGTAAPQAPTSGASIKEILSPTPPVECLSTLGRESPRRSRVSPEATMRSVQVRSSRWVHSAKEMAMSSADICSSATSPR